MKFISESAIRERARKDGITHLSSGVAVVCDGKILVVRRSMDDFLGGYFELPGGGVDEGETISDAAIREVKEETGLVVTRVISIFDGFDYTTDKKPKVRQINFLVAIEKGEVLLSDEHDSYLWIGRNDITSLKATDSMKECIKKAFMRLDESEVTK